MAEFLCAVLVALLLLIPIAGLIDKGFDALFAAQDRRAARKRRHGGEQEPQPVTLTELAKALGDLHSER